MLTYVGWLGSVLFAICGIPQAWQAYRQGHCEGLSWSFLLLWFFGEVFTIIYVLPKFDWPLLFNYGVNFLCLLVLLYYKAKIIFYKVQPNL